MDNNLEENVIIDVPVSDNTNNDSVNNQETSQNEEVSENQDTNKSQEQTENTIDSNEVVINTEESHQQTNTLDSDNQTIIPAQINESEVLINNVSAKEVSVEIVELTKDVKKLLEEMNINTDIKQLSIEKVLKIQSEIQKLIKNTKGLAIQIKDISPTEKVTKIMKITWEVLEQPEINAMLSDEVKNQLKSLNENKEFVELVMAMLDWTSNTVLDSYDNNQDGKVTIAEIEEDTMKCCAPKTCCSCWKGFGSCFSKCWSRFFIKVLCCQCSKDEIVYEQSPQQ